MKINRRLFGQKIEREAERFLVKNGLKPFERNVSCKLGELDLIMKDKDTWVFVEVRYRAKSNFGGGLESVSRPKQLKLIKTILWYRQKQKIEQHPCRCDVIAVEPNRDGKLQFSWVKDALGV